MFDENHRGLGKEESTFNTFKEKDAETICGFNIRVFNVVQNIRALFARFLGHRHDLDILYIKEIYIFQTLLKKDLTIILTMETNDCPFDKRIIV